MVRTSCIKLLIIFGLLIAILSAGCIQMANEKKGSSNQTTIVGKYEEKPSKLGPVVNGVILLDRKFEEKYAGKIVEVTGILTEKDSSFEAEPYEPGKPISQGTEGPISIMRNVTSIKIVGQ